MTQSRPGRQLVIPQMVPPADELAKFQKLINDAYTRLQSVHEHERRWNKENTEELFPKWANNRTLLDTLGVGKVMQFTHGNADEALRMVCRHLRNHLDEKQLRPAHAHDDNGHRVIILVILK